MPNPIISILKTLVPAAIIYFIYQWLGILCAIVAIVLFAGIFLIFNRGIIYHNSAGKKYSKGDIEGSLVDLKKAIDLQPKNAMAHGTYAFLLLKAGHTEEAAKEIEAAYEKASLAADKNKMDVTRALIKWKQDHIDEAINILEELIKTYETTNVYSTLGFLYIEKGDYKKAIDFNLKAREYNSGNLVIMDNLANAYYLSGNYDEAEELYKALIKQKPSFPEAFYNYSKVLEHKGDLSTSIYMLRNALLLKFWNTSTITKNEVEEYLSYLESKEQENEEILE